MNYFELEDKILNILVPIEFIIAFIVAVFFLFTPFLMVKFILKRKFTWWIVILCLIASFGIYQTEVWAWWKFWEWGFMKFGEAVL